MSNNLLKVQSYSVLLPRYNYGDCVQWLGEFDSYSYVFQGIIQHRYWDDDLIIANGRWVYWVKISCAIRDGQPVVFYVGEDLEVTEQDLDFSTR